MYSRQIDPIDYALLLGQTAPINKTSDFTITAADAGKTFTNIGAVGPITGTAAAGLPVGFNFSLMRVVGHSLRFQPESGGRVAVGAGPGDPWLPVDATVELQAQVVTTRFAKTTSGWVCVPDSSNVAQLMTILLLNLTGLAQQPGDPVDGLMFANAAGNTPPYSITCKGVDATGLETGTTYGTLADAGGGLIYTPGPGGPATPAFALFEVSIPGSPALAVAGDLIVYVVSSPQTPPPPAPPTAIYPTVPGIPSGPFQVPHGDGFYLDPSGGAYQAHPLGPAWPGQWDAPSTSLPPVV